MSSAHATAESAVGMTPRVYRSNGKRVRTALAVIAVTQLAWLAALVYGVIWLLTW